MSDIIPPNLNIQFMAAFENSLNQFCKISPERQGFKYCLDTMLEIFRRLLTDSEAFMFFLQSDSLLNLLVECIDGKIPDAEVIKKILYFFLRSFHCSLQRKLLNVVLSKGIWKRMLYFAGSKTVHLTSLSKSVDVMIRSQNEFSTPILINQMLEEGEEEGVEDLWALHEGGIKEPFNLLRIQLFQFFLINK